MAALASALLASPTDERIMQGLLLVLEDEEPYVREAAKLALSNLRRHQPV
jgi:HEAT repeat protein